MNNGRGMNKFYRGNFVVSLYCSEIRIQKNVSCLCLFSSCLVYVLIPRIVVQKPLNSAQPHNVPLYLGLAPSPEFGMDGKMNQGQKMNNKVDGTPKAEPTKSKVIG